MSNEELFTKIKELRRYDDLHIMWSNDESEEAIEKRTAYFKKRERAEKLVHLMEKRLRKRGILRKFEIDYSIEFMKKREYTNARDVLLRRLGDNRRDWYAHFLIGQCYRNLPHEREYASIHLDKALHLRPHEAKVLWARAAVALDDKQMESAEELLNKAISLNPNYVPIYREMGLLETMRNNPTETLKWIEKGLKVIAVNIVKGMKNDMAAFPYEYHQIPYTHWIDYALYAGEALCEIDKCSCVWPKESPNNLSSATSVINGLFWQDVRQKDETLKREFTPNYFNAFREMLRIGSDYVYLLRLKKDTLRSLNDENTALSLEREIEYFKAPVDKPSAEELIDQINSLANTNLKLVDPPK
jgi:tetratricopeptide (TPR) repeat protein